MRGCLISLGIAERKYITCYQFPGNCLSVVFLLSYQIYILAFDIGEATFISTLPSDYSKQWLQSTVTATTFDTSPSEVSTQALVLQLRLILSIKHNSYCYPTNMRLSLGPNSNTSESTGRIVSVLTEPGKQADRNVQASASEPRYEASSYRLFL